MTKFADQWLSYKRLQLRDIRARYWYRIRTWAECQLIAVGVTLGRGDIIHIDHKRAMALEDILVIL